jgi:hypothetical protein
MITLQKNYRQLHVGPVDPDTGNVLSRSTPEPRMGFN